MTKFLFIGGPADGRMIATDGSSHWRVPERAALSLQFTESNTDSADSAFQISDYKKVCLAVDDYDRPLFVYARMAYSPADIISRMIDKYAPKMIEEGNL